MFKLLELELRGHKVLKEIKLNFAPENEINEGPYTTVIIGPNGTGKSNLLRTITDIFREIENIVDGRKEQKLAGCSYRIKYYIEGDTYEYTNTAKDLLFQIETQKVQCVKNGKPITPQELKLPRSIIASSVMLNDRFYVPKDYEGSIYNYLGIRRISSPSVAGTQTYTRRIVELLLDKSNDNIFLDKLYNVLDLIGYKKDLMLDFYPRYRTRIFTGNLTSQYLYDFYVNWKKTNENRKVHPPYGHGFFIKYLKDDSKHIENVVRVINDLSNDFNLNKKGNHFTFSIRNANFVKLYRRELQILGSLNLLSDYGFKLNKKDNETNSSSEIQSEELSSGEYHLFSSLIGVLALIEENSLVFFDEPEISLHPNWQMKYIHFLKEVFNNFYSCQFILATHSHFLVSDLKPDSSHLIGLRNEGKIQSVELPKSTYGWSAEQILLNIFGTTSTRNYYLAEEIGQIIELISEENYNIEVVKNKIKKLSDIDLESMNDVDPLKIVLAKLYKYIN